MSGFVLRKYAIRGLFVKGYKDYGELKAKNFWRIVPPTSLMPTKLRRMSTCPRSSADRNFPG
jgi:hypothetical protein